MISTLTSKLFSKGLMGPICLAVIFHIVLLYRWQHDVPKPEQSTEIEIHISTPPLMPTTPPPQALSLNIKKKTISEAFHDPSEADYLSRWQSHIEKIGNANYPSEAMQNNIRGQLRLLVAINKDGSIHDISLRQSSGSTLLDKAAIQIVGLAAPFEPFPENLQHLDILEIIRTWQFNGSLTAGGSRPEGQNSVKMSV